jgi:murein DD-endopeptidase MepM/ murein hydrolase activator NlpD
MKKLLFLLLFSGMTFFASAFIGPGGPGPSLSRSLTFPVAGKKAKVGSFWGAERDGGKRKHEGIDIFAKKGTPVVAVCDGIIVSSGNTPRGGKTLWLQPVHHSWKAYYAHLDQKKVKPGQVVKKGQPIGTVGNTGNAKYTPSHLHFGIYKTFGGAMNPLPFVKNSPRISVRPGKVVKS